MQNIQVGQIYRKSNGVEIEIVKVRGAVVTARPVVEGLRAENYDSSTFKRGLREGWLTLKEA